MGFFNNILDKLGMGKTHTTTASSDAPADQSTHDSPAAAPANEEAFGAQVQNVDVTAQLEQRAAANAQNLQWRTSIVDLLKLLDLDSSLTTRKELATELGCPADLMADSAKMNIWLHKSVLVRISNNGGNIPKELLK